MKNKYYEITDHVIYRISSDVENWDGKIDKKIPLLVMPKKKNVLVKNQLIRFAKTFDLPMKEINSGDIEITHKELKKAYLEFDPDGIIILGDNFEFPGNYYTTVHGKHHTDNLFQDPENSGQFTTPVGRIYGSLTTIFNHLYMKTNDSNEALIFAPPEEHFSKLVNSGLNQLGFHVNQLNDLNKTNRHVMENVELMLQLSNSSNSRNIIHGNLHSWLTLSNVLFSSIDLQQINFRNYPVVFSQACLTGNFGSFAQQMLNSGALFIGSSSPTFSFSVFDNFEDWRNLPSSDGWKIGFLDLLDELPTIGEVKIEIENTFINKIMNNRKREFFTNFRNHRWTKFDKEMGLLVPIIQYQIFGNPLRYSTVGNYADFDLYKEEQL